jgi:transketolase
MTSIYRSAHFIPVGADGQLTDDQLCQLKQVSKKVRRSILECAQRAQTPHIASALSSVDILVAAYCTFLKIDPSKPADPQRDVCIFSKGHAALALYSILAARGFFPDEYLERFARHGAELAEQPAPYCAPGVELATGSLGHGLPVGLGKVLAQRILGFKRRVLVVLGDGECNEGSVWESALFAPAQKMEELTIVIDFNKWQGTGRSREIMGLDDFRAKWESFGWRAFEAPGHDLTELVRLLNFPPDGTGRPTAIVADTIKGKGISFMEDDNNWHYRTLKESELEKAVKELGLHA